LRKPIDMGIPILTARFPGRVFRRQTPPSGPEKVVHPEFSAVGRRIPGRYPGSSDPEGVHADADPDAYPDEAVVTSARTVALAFGASADLGARPSGPPPT